MLPIIDAVLSIINKIIPDREAAEKLRFEVLKLDDLERQRLHEINLQNIENNKIDSQSDSIWKSGWRPAVAWICVLAFALFYIIFPTAESILDMLGYTFQTPLLNISELMGLLAYLLGYGGFRTYEKVKDKKNLFDYLRDQFGGKLTQAQVDEINKRIS